MRIWLVVPVLAAVLPGIAQPPAVFFSLSSDRTYAPGDTPRVALSANNVDGLDFRMYRVNDPVEFFRKLPQAHGFGGQAPGAPPARTLIEKIHRWKQRTRYRMRRIVRDQFGDEEHRQLAAFFGRGTRSPAKGPGGEAYAEVPVLNPQQLVRTWRVAVNRKNPWSTQMINTPVPGEGLYIVEAVGEGLRAATIVAVTPLAIVKKTSPGAVLVQTLNRATGAPVPSTVRLLAKSGPDNEQKTDDSGIARFTISGEGGDAWTLVATSGSAFAMASVEGWAVRRETDALSMGYIYTDRPIYRPGHKVGFRAILRSEDAKGWTIPNTRDINCEITDPEGKAVDRRTLKLSEAGTISGEWTVPEDAPLGYYSLVFRAGEGSQTGSFRVEEYRKPEYEVKVVPSIARVLQGNRLTFTISAQYFFGEPVVNARVRYTIRRTRHWNWFFGDYDPDDFADEGGDPGFYGEVVRTGEARLDSSGTASIAVPTRIHDFDEDYRVEAEVMDEARREVSGRGIAFASVGNFVLQAEPERYVYAPGESASIRVRAFDYDGKPVRGVTVTMGGASATTNAEGWADHTTVLAKSGSQQVRISSGRVSTIVYLWASGDIAAPPGEGTITLVPDKKSYKAGETARILVVTGVRDTRVLLGVEGRALHRTATQTSDEPSFFYEVPIHSEYAPNVFVTAAFLKDGKYYFGSKSIKVPSERLLDVNIKPSKPQYKPGEPASYTLETRSPDGKAIPSEVSLGIVDEAIYGVQPEMLSPIEKAFYGRTYDRVFTDSSLSYYFYGQAGKRAIPIARRHTTLAQMKPPSPNDPRVRKDFPDTAFWMPSIRTDEQGRATVKLQFPDSITAWRATARAVTPDTRVGSAVSRVTTRKDLILRLAAPRFLGVGDEVVVSAIVNNYLDSDKRTNLSLEVTGAELLAGGTREGVSTAKAETSFDFRIRTRGGEVATLIAKAMTDEESDALQIDLPIKPFGVRITESSSGTLAGTAKAEATVSFPPNSAGRALEIRALPSLAGAIFGALEYLGHYPYGCTEQTLSSFVPNAIADRALRRLNLPAGDRARLNQRIEAGLDRLADYQHPDGGWGFWQADDSGIAMTAQVVTALDDFGRWGRINREKARTWLRKALAQERRADADFRAYVTYALNEPAPMEEIWAARESLSADGLALLGLRSSGERAQYIAAELERRMEPEGYWKSERDVLMDFEVDNSAETTARVVRFFVQKAPESALLPKAAAWLVNNRRDGYYWSSTKQTANVVYALTDYLERSGELNPKLAADVRINGENVWSRELTQADALRPQNAGLRVIPNAADNRLEIASSGRGRLYWSVIGSHYEEKPARLNTAGLSIRREYFRELPGGHLTAFDGIASPGQVIVSRLTVSGGRWRYLMIEDPIPAGVELMKDTRWYGANRELRDDRAAIFETFFEGTRRYEVRMKVTRPGKYRTSPARVAPMYQPGILAVSDAAALEVRP